MNFDIQNITADYNRRYDPATANNGGNYWQYNGTCDVILENGVVIHAEFDDSSCGDFGRRFVLNIDVCGKEFRIWEDRVSGSDDAIAEQYDRNCDVLDQLYELTGVEGYVVDAVAETIEYAAYDKYCADREV